MSREDFEKLVERLANLWTAYVDPGGLMKEILAEHQRLTEALTAAERERDEIGEQLDMAREDHANELAAARGERDGWKVDAEKYQAERDAAQAEVDRLRANATTTAAADLQREADRLRAILDATAKAAKLSGDIEDLPRVVADLKAKADAAQPAAEAGSLEDRVRRLEERLLQEAQS